MHQIEGARFLKCKCGWEFKGLIFFLFKGWTVLIMLIVYGMAASGGSGM